MLAPNRFFAERSIPEPRPKFSMGILAVALCAQLTMTAVDHAETIAKTADRTVEFSVENMQAAWRGFIHSELE